MKEANFARIGSLMGGVVHNLNTPLMWVMGRAQLIQSRNEKLATLTSLSSEELIQLREKNDKDITSILEGAEKIDAILKALGFQVQMVNEGYTSVELHEYLEMELNFLQADMRFKHESKREVHLDSRTYYAKVDFNALSGAVTGVIDAMMSHTDRGRTLRISLEGGVIHLFCPEMALTEEARSEIDAACMDLRPMADIIVDDGDGLKVSLALKDL
jgi:signal transduction histidine kinase